MRFKQFLKESTTEEKERRKYNAYWNDIRKKEELEIGNYYKLIDGYKIKFSPSMEMFILKINDVVGYGKLHFEKVGKRKILFVDKIEYKDNYFPDVTIEVYKKLADLYNTIGSNYDLSKEELSVWNKLNEIFVVKELNEDEDNIASFEDVVSIKKNNGYRYVIFHTTKYKHREDNNEELD